MFQTSSLRKALTSRGHSSEVACSGSLDAFLADKATRLYCSQASTAAAHCALEAWFEGNKAEYGLWFRVFQRLHK